MDTIKAMIALSRQPWAGNIDVGPVREIGSPDGPVVLFILDPSGHLQPGLVVLALYDLLLTMYKQRPGFFKVNCGIFLEDRGLIGLLYMNQGIYGKVQSSKARGNLTESKKTMQAVSLVSSRLNLIDVSGVVVDPEDARFRILWTVHGRSIPVQDIFSAAVDGIATTAQHVYNDPCPSSTGVSFSSNAVFHIGGMFGRTLLCGQIVTAFGLLADLVIKNKGIFREMEFSLEYDGVEIGQGYTLKMSSIQSQGGNDTRAMSTS